MAVDADMTLKIRAKGRENVFKGYFSLFETKNAKQVIIRERNREVRNISAGDAVKFPSDIKPAMDGENKVEDRTFSRALNGKKRNLKTVRMRLAKKI